MRPTQVFKKRNNIFSTQVLANSNATLISEIVLRETGTVYAIKVSMFGQQLLPDAIDAVVNRIWIRCVPAATGLPDLTVAVELDTLNGFLVGSFLFVGADTSQAGHGLNEKFRFRRKCDENTLVQLIGQSTGTNGVARIVEWNGVMQAVIRVK